MASKPIKRGKSWFIQVRKAGVTRSASFSSKADAENWAATTEAEIIAGKRGNVPNKTFGDLLNKYVKEISPTHKGERWEKMRVGLTLRDPIAQVKLADLDARAVAAWRDRRLAQVSPASVRREWNLLSSACSVAAKEWKWLNENPMREVKRPPVAEARDRIATDDEIERLLHVLGYSSDETPKTVSARLGATILFAVETAMRAGEIANLMRIDIKGDFCQVREGKTSAAKRDVPLSVEAIRILNQMPQDSLTVFGISASQMDALFRKAKTKAMVTELHYHDLRHTAITRLALSGKLNVLELARMVGHRDLKMLMVYFNPSASDMAKRLG